MNDPLSSSMDDGTNDCVQCYVDPSHWPSSPHTPPPLPLPTFHQSAFCLRPGFTVPWFWLRRLSRFRWIRRVNSSTVAVPLSHGIATVTGRWLACTRCMVRSDEWSLGSVGCVGHESRVASRERTGWWSGG